MREWLTRWRELATTTWARRLVIGGYVALLTAVIGAYFSVSMAQVQTAAYIRGAENLEIDRPNALRGVVLRAPTGKNRRNVAARFWLHEPTDQTDDETEATSDSEPRGTRIAEIESAPDGVLEGSLEVPSEFEPGTYELVLRASSPNIETFERTTEVDVVEGDDRRLEWFSTTPRAEDDERREQLEAGPVIQQEGDLAVELLPPDGEIPSGVGTTVFLRTFDPETGKPVPARVKFTKIEGRAGWPERAQPPEAVETDAMGLKRLEVVAGTDLRWTLEARASDTNGSDEEAAESPKTGKSVLRLLAVPAQMDVALERTAIRRDAKPRGRVETLFPDGDIFVDLYRGGDWLYAGRAQLRNRGTSFALDVPDQSLPDEPTWFRIQTSRHVYGANHTWSIGHFVSLPSADHEALRSTLAELVSLVADRRESTYFEQTGARLDDVSEEVSSEQLQEWTRAYAKALPRHFEHSNNLFNTQKADRAALETWKRGVKDDLFDVIAVALAGALAVILYVVTLGIQRHRRHAQQLREVDAELPEDLAEFDEDAVETQMSERPSREGLRVFLLGVVAISAFVMFGLGLLLVLSYM